MQIPAINATYTNGPYTLSDLLLDRLLAWEVDTIFGIPGDGVNGFMEALRRKQGQIRFIHVRHEEMGALAAVSYAKLTGKIGVCFGTTGPGAVHLLNGLLDAQMDHVPLLAITGITFHDLIGSENMQGYDSNKMMEPFTVYNERVMGPAHVEGLVDRACRTTLTKRRPVHIAIPADFQSLPADHIQPSKENVPHHTSALFHLPIRIPEKGLLTKAADLLNTKSKVAILVGVGASGAGDEVAQIAELLGAPVIKSMLGKDVIADDSPYTTGGTGHTTTAPSKMVMDTCDCLLIIGSTMPYLKWYPKPNQAACIQIDDMPERIGMRYPATVGLAGDAKATLQELLPLLRQKQDRTFLEQAQAGMARWWQFVEAQAARTSLPMKPQVPAQHLSSLLADDAILLGDAGTVAYWINKHIKLRKGQRFTLSGTSCTMASGISYGIGAQAAFPKRQVVVMTGDGAMTMALGELLTLAQYQLPVKLLVFKNNTLALEKWEQMGFMGNPEFGNDLLPADFVKIAEGCGVRAIKIDDPTTCRQQLQEALMADGPVLIECVVDPHEPALATPLPEEHAANFLESFDKISKDKSELLHGLRESLQQQMDILPETMGAQARKLLDALKEMD
ncbi:pyruvate oxidase [Cnuella takakiae]|uniref:Pyruvate oxidase n=1 Tax=Cnuella takakiae TaxID=1302690 RepID=A0A1M5IY01_9BACT|nr:thiamine pyrophosphate-dependent enzyme [Cnuella takakiae]OLY91415.1 pyruvate oxidase [Cnuella takakiae]SHG33248.1 pyruvate oxidase [Cnuella takakiae]